MTPKYKVGQKLRIARYKEGMHSKIRKHQGVAVVVHYIDGPDQWDEIYYKCYKCPSDIEGFPFLEKELEATYAWKKL